MNNSIFAAPGPKPQGPYGGVKVLFLHGLEGSPTGAKSLHLQKNWSASCPPIRTEKLRSVKSENSNIPWTRIEPNLIEDALAPAVKDAVDAINYLKPDVVVGSSMGGAILAKIISEEIVDHTSFSKVFLAPAIYELLGNINLPEMKDSVWILGESDFVVNNSENVKKCLSSNGNLILSPSDSHRLSNALSSGMIDAAITTCIEIRSNVL